MKDWKTTILGALTAISVAVYPLVTTGTIVWSNVGLGALIGLIGYFAKDK